VRKKICRSVLVLLIAIVGSATVFANGSAEGKSIKTGDGASETASELTFMLNASENDAQFTLYKEIITQFNEMHEGEIKVDLQAYENEQFKTKLATLMASNSAPDIFFTWELSYLEPFVRGGKVVDITEYLDADPAWKESFGSGTLDLLSYDGRNYAIPSQKTLCVMFYNKEIFAENDLSVPTTWQEFQDVCATLKARGITPMAMSGTDAWIPAQFMQQISNGIGGVDLFNGINEGRRKWNDPAHIEAAKQLQAMVEKGYFQSGFLGMNPDISKAQFFDGKAAMYFMGSWEVGNVYNELGENGGAFCLPAMNPEYDNISVGSTDASFGIGNTCEDVDAAIEFLKYRSSEAVESRFLYETGLLPARNMEIDSAKLNPLFARISEISKQQQGLSPWWDRAFGAGEGVEFNNTVVAVCSGEDVQTLFDDLQAFAEANADR
jgi:raffinose/stachyose/melibiose transport system substrate-binding protein